MADQSLKMSDLLTSISWRGLSRWIGGPCLVTALSIGGVLADDDVEVPVAQARPAVVKATPGFKEAPAKVEANQSVVPTILPVPDAGYTVPTTTYPVPSVVGYYEVGHIPNPVFAHLFHYSGFNPYLDSLSKPLARTVSNGRHDAYYAGYRTIYTPQNWGQIYVPQQQACGAYTANYGGAPRGGAVVPTGTPGFPYAYSPAAAYSRTDNLFSEEPQFYAPYGYTNPPGFSALPSQAPYGPGSASYFGMGR